MTTTDSYRAFLADSALGRVLTARSACQQVLWLIDGFQQRIEADAAEVDELQVIQRQMRELADRLDQAMTQLKQEAA